ncbi:MULTISPECIES: hypothetical protein [Caballeronia]|jgi:hypothetical protein|uniref:hypothetical protein n=1 Tax=Caballeronia TaxID=1827195 RepID=UPI000310D283|nr:MULTISPECIES: hypothetical protein [Caballeronia]MCG7399413.1 hypothetical protein [Caballeronia zhejiangensis]MDR5764090.1 hypothetical protein [Caballeronia sp. LZ028]MDR5785659.1 hypothetical protein [Caballeronia sp. LP003]MDR5792000.1 hypothetical protein [Caballeronia sp. LZ008]
MRVGRIAERWRDQAEKEQTTREQKSQFESFGCGPARQGPLLRRLSKNSMTPIHGF